MNPLVSVIVTCYNQGFYLDKTIDSVLSQSYKNYEIIVVDDGSRESDTIAILDSLEQKGIKIIHIENAGVSNARNVGINNSSGEFILILDGDDLILDSYLEKTAKILVEKPNVKVVTTGVRTFGTRNGTYTYPKYSFDKLLTQNLMVVSSLFRRKDFISTNGFSVNMKEGLEDWDFWISLLKNGGGVHHIDDELFLYRRIKISRNTARVFSLETKFILIIGMFMISFSQIRNGFLNIKMS